jgi:hypothetical protein
VGGNLPWNGNRFKRSFEQNESSVVEFFYFGVGFT